MKNRWLALVHLCSFLVWTSVGVAASQTVPDGTVRIHYLRPDGAYAGWELHVWEDTTEVVTWADGLDVTGTDDDGVYWDVSLSDDARRIGFIIHAGDLKDPGPDMFVVLDRHGREVWVVSGSDEVLTERPLAPVEDGTARIHYHRPDGDVDGFELHVWDAAADSVTWQDGLDPSGVTTFGPYWVVRLRPDSERLGFIVHRGDEKDPGPDQFLDVRTGAAEAWIVSGNATVFTAKPDLAQARSGDLSAARAHWVAPDLIAWDVGIDVPGTRYTLHAGGQAELSLGANGVRGGRTFELSIDPNGLPSHVVAKAPHLASMTALRLPLDAAADAGTLVRGPVAVASARSDGTPLDATSLQIPWLLDALYAESARDVTLGPSWNDSGDPTVRVWAPTAATVRLLLHGDGYGVGEPTSYDMAFDASSGVWSVLGDRRWNGRAYTLATTVFAPTLGAWTTHVTTDPYATALTRDSRHALLIDPSEASTMPAGWTAFVPPAVEAPEDIVVYELHLRDFSATASDVPVGERGTYMAFTHGDSAGMRHLTSIARAGVTHLHLLPTFDIATIPEDRSTWSTPVFRDEVRPSSSAAVQEAIEAVRDRDGFNWGYDPWHFGVPEGSYATTPDGAARIVEYRSMVMALGGAGMATVADVVFNHTSGSGIASTSVLDKLVPGYYHRLDASGFVTTSTCCQNTATEHAMMRKLMVDMVVRWAREYKIGAFRFDLMGHHMVDDMLAVRDALDALTPADDGVDGSSIYLYGEGWDFGEVAGGARGVNATQANLAGTGIGSFNDRLRDAVRGGGPFDGGIDLLGRQGFASGAGVLPNAGSPDGRIVFDVEQRTALDWIRLGMAGNLADFVFETSDGSIRSGADVDYFGRPAGYTSDPQENVVYVSKHDNQTLFDILAYKLPSDLPMDERVRLQVAALATVAFAQGVPFFHAGSELLRSKSLDRNSYDSGDAFNAIDWTGETHTFGVGLPRAADNRRDWQFMRSLLDDPRLVPSSDAIASTTAWFEAMLQVRSSSPLFRLRSSSDVIERVMFHNTGADQLPGLIVMSLDDRVGTDLDAGVEGVLVVINASPVRRSFVVDEWVGADFRLHPALVALEDDRLSTAAFFQRSGRVSIPAFTTAVYTLPAR